MTPSIPGSAYRIHTARVVIRCWHPQDAPLLQTAIAESLDHLRPWMAWAHSEPEDLQTKIERLRRFRGLFDLGQDYVYGIFLKSALHSLKCVQSDVNTNATS